MFSEIVDDVCHTTNRVDARDLIIKWCNEGIRRIEGSQYFTSSLKEEELTLDTDGVSMKTAYCWVWDRSADVRLLSGVVINNNIYPINAQPGLQQKSLVNYWYKVGTYYVFVCSSPIRSIQVAYYSHPRAFTYQPEEQRQFMFNRTDNRYYKKVVNADGTNEWVAMTAEEKVENEKALDALGNWLCRDYALVISASATSSLYATFNDADRFRNEFAKYKELLKDLRNNEKFANFGYGS